MRLPVPHIEPTLRNILQQQLLSCGPATPIAEAARRMVEARCSSILVEERGGIIGIWTERDALALDASDPASFHTPIAAAMSAPVKTIHADTNLGETARRFREEGVRHFLVTDDAGSLLGIVSQSDVVAKQGIEYFVSLREVKAVFSRRMLLVGRDTPAATAMREMSQGGFDALIVKRDGGGDHGILTERDVMKLIGSGVIGGVVADIATFPLITVAANTSLYQARKQFVEHNIRHLGVTGDNDDELLGLVTFADILSNIELEYVRQLKDALREREEVLAISNKQLRLAACAFDSTCEGILVTNAEQVIESVNPAFTMITGYRAHEVIGKRPSFLASGRHDEAFYADMYRRLEATSHWQGEVWNRRRSGEVYVQWLTINVVRGDNGKIRNYVAVFSDITYRKAAEERMSFLAQHDALTGLPNRVLLADRLAHALAHAQRNSKQLALIFLDLDEFKQVNDRIGHHAGDHVLQIVAQRLSACVRQEDTVARLGGDEFVVIIEDLAKVQDSSEIAAKFLDALAQPILIDSHSVTIGCSIGIGLYPEHGIDPDALLRNADAAMYLAKAKGSNQFHFASAADAAT